MLNIPDGMVSEFFLDGKRIRIEEPYPATLCEFLCLVESKLNKEKKVVSRVRVDQRSEFLADYWDESLQNFCEIQIDSKVYKDVYKIDVQKHLLVVQEALSDLNEKMLVCNFEEMLTLFKNLIQAVRVFLNELKQRYVLLWAAFYPLYQHCISNIENDLEHKNTEGLRNLVRHNLASLLRETDLYFI
ncbi:MAG: hypothetical protein LBD69_02755 [Puniceicoccales bacterium]|jgi:hypothetical protein|nr:hypothetical protein [Puniceicoccales bacterium]